MKDEDRTLKESGSLKDKIGQTAAININTILNKYKEQTNILDVDADNKEYEDESNKQEEEQKNIDEKTADNYINSSELASDLLKQRSEIGSTTDVIEVDKLNKIYSEITLNKGSNNSYSSDNNGNSNDYDNNILDDLNINEKSEGDLIATSKLPKEEIDNIIKNSDEFENDKEDNLEEVQGKEEIDLVNKADDIIEKQSFSVDYSNMYKKAFGVDTIQVQREKREIEESMNASSEIKAAADVIFNDNEIPPYNVIGVAFKTYIIIQMEGEIYIIDQHAAHERLIYEEVKYNFFNEKKDSQMLLLPDDIKLSYRENELVKENKDIFNKAGFEFEEFGINVIKLTAVPAMVEILNTKQLFLDIIDGLDSNYVTGKDEIIDNFLATIACKAAVKANMALSEREIRALLDKLLRLNHPFTCPHGRPTAVKFTKGDLERKFKRK